MAEQQAEQAGPFINPAALMEVGRRVADSTPEETPTEPQDSEQYTAAKSARIALIWPTEPLTPVEYEARLEASLRARSQLSEAEAERLDAYIDSEMCRQITILQRFVAASEPAQPEEAAPTQKETSHGRKYSRKTRIYAPALDIER